ncbi:uncharacterized protein LOC143145348 [Ptiloglossa arizonensis]|uniref:uncharacterized protein LOC143145348 n=1 Tax=Ptiloglossa arizonensis TaxID=3350558 RepID=UPI003FA08F6C
MFTASNSLQYENTVSRKFNERITHVTKAPMNAPEDLKIVSTTFRPLSMWVHIGYIKKNNRVT